MNWRKKSGGSGKRRGGKPSSSNPPPPQSGSSDGGDWRGGQKKKSGTGSRPPITSTMAWSDEWTQKSGYHKGDRKLWFRLKLALLGAVALGLIGVLLGVVFYFPTRTPMLSLTVTSYDGVIPPNSLALEDVERFVALFDENRNVAFERSESRSMNATEMMSDLRDWLQSVEPGGPRSGNGVVLLYLSCHGLVNDDGQPCLLTSEAKPTDASTWTPAEDYLRLISESDKLAGARKVVLLDSNRIQSEWSCGILYNDFVERLGEVVTRIDDPNLVLLNSTGAGERGWTDPLRDGSAFGYAVAQALAGEADLDRDQKISLYELNEFLADNVSERVRQERGAVQRPTLIPADAPDFPLVWVTDRTAPADPDPDEVLSGIESLSSQFEVLWDRHEELALGAPFVERPAQWAELEHKLQRSERLLLAGEAYRGELEALLSELSQEMQLIARPIEDRSPWANLAGLDTSQVVAGRETLKKWREAKLNPDTPPEEMPRTDYTTAAATVWKITQEGNPGRGEIQELLSFLAEMGPPPAVDLPEVHLVKSLVQWVEDPESGQFLATAIRNHAAGQAAAQPSDRRAHYWIDSLVEKADASRRLAEDHLLAGDQRNLREADRLWDQLSESEGSESYRVAKLTGDTVSEAYLLRDRAWASWPSLARYVTALIRIGEADAEAHGNSLRLLEALRDLSRELDESWTTDANVAEVDRLAKEVKQQLDGLMRLYRDRENEMLDRRGDRKQATREIGLLLDSPLTTGGNRNQLRAKYLRLAFTETGADEEEPSAAPDDDDAYLEVLTSRNHPAFELVNTTDLRSTRNRDVAVVSPLELRESAPRAERRERLQTQSAHVRGLLGDLRQHGNRLMLDFTEQFESGDPTPPAEVRADLSAADRLLRARVPIAGSSVWTDQPADPSPTTRLRNVDDFFALLWLGHRVIADGWGPSPDGAPAYFEQIADGYLSAASLLASRAAAYSDQLRRALDERRGVLSRVAESNNGVQARVKDRYVSAGAQASQQTASLTWDPVISEGLASFYVTDDQGSTVQLQTETEGSVAREPLRLEDRQLAAVNFRFSHESVGEQGLHFQANTLYRFHHRANRFILSRPGKGDMITIEPAPYQRPRVAVQGDARKKSWIIFILDCSGSMNKTDGAQPTRLARATAALNQILEKLETNAHQVGVLCYGHRAHWSLSAPYNIEPGDAADKRIDPREDVDWLAPDLRRANLDTALRDRVQRLVKSDRLQARGETPLYLAMQRALRTFNSAVDAPQSRHLVVITDGVDKQFDPPPARRHADIEWLPQGFESVRIETVGELHQTAKLKDVSVDMVFMGSVDPGDQSRFAELQSFAAAGSNRNLREVSRTQDLIDELIDALGAYEFYVKRAGEPDPPRPNWRKLGENWTVDWNGSGDRQFEVMVRGSKNRVASKTSLELFGGEQIELFLNGTRLEHRRFDVGPNQSLLSYPSTADLQEPGNADQSFFIGVHRPLREPAISGMKFQISIQNVDATMASRRPRQMWAEITPKTVGGRRKLPPYVIYDLEFEPNQPVAVANLRVPGWPAGHELGELQLWLKTQAPRAQNIVSVEEALKIGEFNAIGEDSSIKVRVVTQGGRSDGEAYRVIVTEQHRDPATMRTLRCQMTPPPQRWSHNYINDAGELQHIFEYKDKFEATNAKVHLTHRDRIQTGAIATGPIEVALPR